MALIETRKRRIKTLAQRDEEAKRMKSAEVRRQERHEVMDKEIAEQRRQIANLRSNTTEITKAVDEGNLDKVIEKAKELNKNALDEVAKFGSLVLKPRQQNLKQ